MSHTTFKIYKQLDITTIKNISLNIPKIIKNIPKIIQIISSIKNLYKKTLYKSTKYIIIPLGIF